MCSFSLVLCPLSVSVVRVPESIILSVVRVHRMSDPDGRSRDGPTLIPRDPRGEGKMFQNLEGRRKKREEKREKKESGGEV